MTPTKLKILLSGMIAGVPGHGGATWAVLQYMLGLRELGHDVRLVEPVERASLTPPGASFQSSQSAAYFEALAKEFSLHDRAALLITGSRETIGMPYDDVVEFARHADMLINISGMLTDSELLDPIGIRVYLDLDPAFIQMWHVSGTTDMRFDAHNVFVTVGQAIGSPNCTVPTADRDWIPTLQPVVLSHWPVAEPVASDGPLTTVANWRGYGSIDYEGTFYGQKAHSLRPLIELPLRVSQPILLALGIHPDEVKDLELLKRNGWQIVDPATVTATPDDYQRFVQQSWGELGIAKSGYVASRCGWFSDRSACYLASGRPVVAQDTGFSQYLPTGEGLFSFTTIDDAVAAIETIRDDYTTHSRSARMLAEQHFDSGRVLGSLLEKVMSA